LLGALAGPFTGVPAAFLVACCYSESASEIKKVPEVGMES
jgi:hypothetical protein